jgi:hypothetical protein
MNNRIGKPVLAAILLAALALAAYWYWSPFLVLRSMQAAAQAHDAQAFNDHVDYPRLRASLKTQLAAAMEEKMAAAGPADNPLAAFGKSIGKMMGATMVDKLVDVMVRPETVMRGMASGQFGVQQAPAAAATAAPDAPAAAPAPRDAKPEWDWMRVGSDKLIAYQDDDSPGADGKKVEVVFERSGFANWKLTDLRLPR